jgi:hypothetical protein
MQAPTSKEIEFRFGLAGMVSNAAPELLTDGQYRYANNVTANQQGSLSSRTGPKKIGNLTSGQPTCYHIRKMTVTPGENPLVPSVNPRYLGINTGSRRDLYRTVNYTTATAVATGVDANSIAHWEMDPYSAGDTGAPWAYFACPNGMLKDSGLNPYTTLPEWGIAPAHGVCMAAVVDGMVSLAALPAGFTETTPAVLFLVSPTGVADNDVITPSGVGVVPNVCATGNGLYYAKVVGYSNTLADPYYTAFGQGGAFALYDSNGQGVAPSGAYNPAGSISGVAVTGNLNGGATTSPNGTQPYDWVVTYLEGATHDEGNPSQTMSAQSLVSLMTGGITYLGVPLAVNGGQAKVLAWGVANNTRFPTINVYRRGGTLTDQLYRLVATVTNPGYGNYVIFTDNTADADLVYQNIVQTDNDPPVPSTVSVPITATLNGSVSTQYQTVNLTVTGGAWTNVTPGSTCHVQDPTTPEDVVVVSVTSTSITAYFQFAHASGTPVEVDTIMGQACNLVASIGDQKLVAGDPNNPHILYKSKAGSPQAFPVGVDAAGAVTSVGVGTPANGIVNMCEYRGQIACMNVSALFEVPVIQSSLYPANRMAEKGLVAQSAWCKTETELWFLSNDGVYSWDGGQLMNRTLAIDPIFHGEQFNNIAPVDYSSAAILSSARMEYRRGVVRLVYQATDGNIWVLMCEPRYGGRWTQANENQPAGGSSVNPITTIYREPDTNSLIIAVHNSSIGATFGIADAMFVSGGINYTSDWWSTNGQDGSGIAWSVKLPWFDLGRPTTEKIWEEIWLDMDPQIYNGQSSITVQLLLNYSDTVIDTFNIAIPSGSSFVGRSLLSLLPNMSLVSGSTYQSYGREARAISFALSGVATPVQCTFFRLICQYQETGMVSAGSATDWMNLGNPHDKRAYQMKVTFDTAGTNRQLVLETRGGRDCLTANPAGSPVSAGSVQLFSLVSPSDLGSGRCSKTFPLADQTIAKLFRVRPYSSATEVGGVPQSSVDLWRIFDVEFPEAENYPPDVVTVTPWDDGGSNFLKYLNQVELDVNTNGQAITVQIQADGANIGPTFTVTTTEQNRRFNWTAPTSLSGYKWRIFVDPTQSAIASGAGMFQLFNLHFGLQPADKGEVGHTFQWDDLGHPYDKYLKTVTIDWDLTGLGGVTLQMDTITGITGQTENMNVAQFALGTARGKQTFGLAADTIVKMIRVYPIGSPPGGYKQWGYKFDFDPYPADTILSTGWKDASSPNDKNPSWLYIDADTAGVAASVILQNESGTVMTVSHTGSVDNRKKNYPIPVDTFAKMWRLTITPGGGGKFQAFSWGFERWQETPQASPQDPPDVVLWTPWNDFGYPYPKTARNLILTIDSGGVNCSIPLQNQENGTVQTFTVNTTYTTRRQVIACNPNLTGTMWRLLLSPGGGGRAKLWAWVLDAVKLPPALTQWSSYGQGFGYIGWKIIKQIWVDYVCAGGMTLTLTSDTGTLVLTFPPQATRGVQRMLLPDIWGSGFNKSKLYSFEFLASNSADPFQIYADVSGAEWMPCGADRHTAYSQAKMSEFMQVAI